MTARNRLAPSGVAYEIGPGCSLEASGATGRAGAVHQDDATPTRSSWRLWLPALLGPPRKRTKTIAGVKYTAKVRRPELPPSPNDRMHFRTKAPLIKAWRDAACDAAKSAGIPPLGRIRFSAVIYRTRLGHADEDNDRGRCKSLLDGLRDAKVIANDTRGFVEHGTVTEEKGPVGVLLIVERIS